jgi:hypothetical protein
MEAFLTLYETMSLHYNIKTWFNNCEHLLHIMKTSLFNQDQLMFKTLEIHQCKAVKILK